MFPSVSQTFWPAAGGKIWEIVMMFYRKPHSRAYFERVFWLKHLQKSPKISPEFDSFTLLGLTLVSRIPVTNKSLADTERSK